MSPRVVSRAETGLRPPTHRTRMRGWGSGWFVHYNGPAMRLARTVEAEMAAVRGIQRYHQGKGWSDIGYTRCVGQTGVVYEARGYGIAGAHTENHNSTGMALMFLIGEGESPSPAALESAVWVLGTDGPANGYEPKRVRPHHAVGQTACPGHDLTRFAASWRSHDVPRFENEVNEALQLLREHSSYTGDDDGEFGPMALAALHGLKNYAANRAALVESLQRELNEALALIETLKARGGDAMLIQELQARIVELEQSPQGVTAGALAQVRSSIVDAHGRIDSASDDLAHAITDLGRVTG